MDGEEEVHGFSGPWPEEGCLGLNVSLSKFSSLGSEWTEKSLVNGSEFRPLVIRAIGIEGVVVPSLDGLWGLGSGEGIWGIRVTILILRGEVTHWQLREGYGGPGMGKDHPGTSSHLYHCPSGPARGIGVGHCGPEAVHSYSL